jgi:uncharacterized SAM-binding protein YcdF (DUF218 family)
MSRLKYLLAIFVSVAALWLVIAPYIAAHLIVEKPLDHANALIVLSGSSVYKERTKRAAELYREGIAPIVMITNDGERSGWSQTEERNIPYVELEQRELVSNGVSADSIVTIPGIVTGTHEEARAVAGEIDRLQIRSLLIVTSPYHTRRAYSTFEKTLAGKGIKIGITHSSIDETRDAAYWWLSLSGWQTIGGEYVKTAVYWAFY